MLMKTSNEEMTHKITFIKDFFNNNPSKTPDYIESVYDNAEGSKELIDGLYRFLKMETSSVLNIDYIAAYGYTKEKVKPKGVSIRSDEEFKHMLKLSVSGDRSHSFCM